MATVDLETWQSSANRRTVTVFCGITLDCPILSLCSAGESMNFYAHVKVQGGTPEPVPNFADVQLIETGEAWFYFDNERDENGIRWASPL